MPSILKIRITCARDLPVMDRTSELTDAYVELRFADFEPQRTHVWYAIKLYCTKLEFIDCLNRFERFDYHPSAGHYAIDHPKINDC